MTREMTVGGCSTQWWAQLATAVAAGLAFATRLMLILTPGLLVLGGQLKQQQVYQEPVNLAYGEQGQQVGAG
ncbi:MAG: hypothetical protein ACE5NW_17515 [Acidiferrobacterales bacterium]